MSRACIDIGSPTLRIRAGDQIYAFEIINSGGLVVLDDKDDPAPDPPKKSPFWRAVELWRRQGMTVDDAGVCVYGPAPQQRYRKIGNILIQMSSDEPDDADTVYRDIY